MLQLDALRAVAVGAVIYHHLASGGAHTAAVLGVKLFFSISGFLITAFFWMLGAVPRPSPPIGLRR
jgi:peptidoglycan/LPS O-acetylase OafA/YrhL